MSEFSRKLLIIGPSWVGDMIMAQSLFKVLKRDGNDVSVLAPGWTHPILDRMPEVSKSIEMPVGHGKFDLISRLKLAKTIKQDYYDQAIVLPGSLKSALIPFFAKISRRTGYLGEQRYGLLSDILPLDKEKLPTTVQRFANLAKPFSHIDDIPKPRLNIDTNTAKQIARRFNYDPDRPLLALCPGAEYGPAKRWPVQRFAALAKQRHEQGWQIWLMGSEKDRESCNMINQLAQQCCTNLAGETLLTEAIDLMSLASVVVTNDSGLMHLAAALQRPLIGIYGSSSPLMTPPLSHNSKIIWLQLDCGPCFKRICPLGHLKCLYDIDMLQVDQAISCLHNSEK